MPSVLHAGQWRGLQVLVQSALPVWLPRAPLTPRRLTAAMLDVAGCCGYTTGTLARQRLLARAARPAAPGRRPARGRRARRGGRLLAKHAGDTAFRYGAWHGDWAPWNMANLADALLVWDWERFATGVPLGFDAVHHELQKRIQSHRRRPGRGRADRTPGRRAARPVRGAGRRPAR